MPKTPNLSEEALKKQMNQVTSTDLSLYVSFQQDELDELESYDMNFDGDDFTMKIQTLVMMQLSKT